MSLWSQNAEVITTNCRKPNGNSCHSCNCSDIDHLHGNDGGKILTLSGQNRVLFHFCTEGAVDTGFLGRLVLDLFDTNTKQLQ